MPRLDGAIDLAQFAPSRNPASGRNMLYPKSDGKWYSRDSSGVETLVGPYTLATHTHVATTDLTATGTKDGTTFLRGDNTWAAPSSTATVTSWKTSVRLATTANILLSPAATSIDGFTANQGDRVLVKDQSSSGTNGIYFLDGTAWTRVADMDAWSEVPNAAVFVEQGTANADTGWICTSDQGGTLNTTAITWTKFMNAGGAPPAHNHAASEITSGVVDLARLGTTPASGDFLKAGGTSGSADWTPVTKTDVGLANVANAAQVDLTTTQTIGGLKTFTNPIYLTEVASTSTPGGGIALIYAKTDGMPYWKGDDGAERPLIEPVEAVHSNPSFEAITGGVPDNWNLFWVTAPATLAIDTTTSYSGVNSMKSTIGGSGSTNLLSSVFAVTGGSLVTLSFFAKTGQAGEQFAVNLLCDSAGNGNPDLLDGTSTWAANPAPTIVGTTTWTKYSASFAVPPDQVTARFFFGFAELNSTAWIDETSSTMQTATAGTIVAPNQQIFTTLGASTWTKPLNTVYVMVEVQGAGGAGGGVPTTAASQVAATTGGGGGVYARSIFPSATVAATAQVTVGAGGTGGTGAGPAGGTSSFGTGAYLVSAVGGNGGITATAQAAPQVGVGTPSVNTGTGQLVVPGGQGVAAVVLSATSARGGAGGPSHWGAGAQVSATVSNGFNGFDYGGGGGGACNTQSQGSARTGGNGGNGIVIVTSYITT